ncbi:MarR family winged helix-turn-helix transcriptional regulator [Sediminivirga luteola]|uniref:HTH marR-type domain-containing protein n=1 Tax=Sediminivirga luteola TaxID=1774748 RepID=A0A8J2XLY0_9MICO|nr:MarR family transcriptional regulator [Sediminivirga luteola]MCI2265110.1 MarR family transcriptional regulator [Sediminivirga luteola]GGA21841.1 hypothetical protein GCM10011333_26100 [Sediminivirga luteola]
MDTTEETAPRGRSGRPGRAARANAAWEALLTAHAVLMKEFTAENIWDEISIREYDVLYTLSKCSAPQKLRELHQHVLLSQPALSRMVDRLVQRGLVDREPDPDDRRATRLSLTEAGRKAQRRVGRKHAASVAAAVGRALDDDEMVQLEALCRKLLTGTGDEDGDEGE